jgi:hypothetical protein
MPVLSFPCVIHRVEPHARPTSRRVWIKGHDLRTLARAAVTQLGVAEQDCAFALVSPDAGATPRAFLELSHADGDALVGPMAAPLPTPTMSDRGGTLESLLEATGFAGLERTIAPDSFDPRRYLAVVTYAPICAVESFPPQRRPHETDADYQRRYEAVEHVRIERGSQQGFHVLRYDMRPKDWTAQDLEGLMACAYELLPAREPRWRESGHITQAKFASPQKDGRITLAYCLQVARGEYIVHVRLPMFPASALVDWLTHRHCEISLLQPTARLEVITRGWRHIERIDRERGRVPEVHDLAAWVATVDAADIAGADAVHA